MLHLVLAESALELVPESMQDHPSAKSHSRRLGRDAGSTLLDISWHYAAMRGYPDVHKRGRPDLVHQAILAAVATPLYRNDMVRIYIHTITDVVVEFGSGVRVPKSYHRFEGLFARLLLDGHAGEAGMLRAYACNMPSLLDAIKPTISVGLSKTGNLVTCSQMTTRLGAGACVVVGGFQRGSFSDATGKTLDEIYAISPLSLETHLVVSRLLYDVESATA